MSRKRPSGKRERDVPVRKKTSQVTWTLTSGLHVKRAHAARQRFRFRLSRPQPSNVRGFRLSRSQPINVRGPRRPFCRPLCFFFFLVRQEGRGKRRGPRARPPRRKQRGRETAARLHETGHSQPAAPPAPRFAGARKRTSAGSSCLQARQASSPFWLSHLPHMTVPLPV